MLYFEQEWHSDGDHQSKSEHLTPYALNIFVPLVDIDHVQNNGPTK